MSKLKITALVLATMMVAGDAYAASCTELWYDRNQIYDRKGYCFNTEKGRIVFNNDDCYTSNPRFSRSEQRRIDAIKRQERRKGCTYADVQVGG